MKNRILATMFAGTLLVSGFVINASQTVVTGKKAKAALNIAITSFKNASLTISKDATKRALTTTEKKKVACEIFNGVALGSPSLLDMLVAEFKLTGAQKATMVLALTLIKQMASEKLGCSEEQVEEPEEGGESTVTQEVHSAAPSTTTAAH